MGRGSENAWSASARQHSVDGFESSSICYGQLENKKPTTGADASKTVLDKTEYELHHSPGWRSADGTSNESHAVSVTTLIISNCCSTCCRLAVIPMSNCAPTPNSTPRFGVSVDLGGRNGTNQNVNPRFLFDFYAHFVLHRLATIHNAVGDRESDRNRPPRLSASAAYRLNATSHISMCLFVTFNTDSRRRRTPLAGHVSIAARHALRFG